MFGILGIIVNGLQKRQAVLFVLYNEYLMCCCVYYNVVDPIYNTYLILY